ncbi:LysM peptidoglycan-binding domain-containing protein [Halothermothrix orenii]|uniref:Polysaccharide deacetylase n=1 Tax=Halothermothrix orenii (strain H 168 / OCM 544 / DSM 9562) TaxID=373903 RepID=B8D2H4_HALOH|nr:LysM peptidoglycan-binding domain-containing protein [Halothermothrix orenii]ACL69401.1 polysaccharide deacetylase [Halothermothrix orenii H 168]
MKKFYYHYLKSLSMYLSLIIILTLFMPLNIEAAKVHRVKPGENLYSIARKYGVTVNEIIRTNNLRNPGQFFSTQALIIPDAYRPNIYRVQKGDTLYLISKKLEIPMDFLAKVNYLTDKDELYERQVLYVPAWPRFHKVKPGDTLYKISKRYGISLKRIKEANQLYSHNNLKIGQYIKVPAPEYKPPERKDPQYTKLFPDTFFLSGKTNGYNIALTFDDGPDNIYTPKILDILKKYNVRATFFLMGSRADRYPDIVKRMVREGHIVANHTWSHVNLNKTTSSRFYNEITNTSNTIKNHTSLTPALVRPPYGAVSTSVIKRLKNMGFKVIFWSVDSRDWNTQDVDKILINTLPNVRKDSIILFHSAGGEGHDLSATVRALPELINTLRMLDYRFVNLTQLLGIKAYQ